MRTRTRTLALIASTALAGTALVAGPAIAAPDYSLNASGIQQTVLRAQMPTALGAWRQNIYFAMKDSAPSVCWSSAGTPVSLPKAEMGGGVGYEVNTNINGSVMIYQYKDLSAAQAALAALKKVDCPDSAKVSEDGPDSAVKADQGSDFTDASMTGFVSSVTYKEGGTPVTTITRTTQRGLAVVQTEVTVAGQANTTTRIARAGAVSTRWHRQVLAAYEAFGSGNSR
jgi:hypothetical protein